MDILERFSLKGRKALVTGSSRGIGKAIAMLLGEAGAEVIFHGIHPSSKLEQTLAEAKEKGICARCVTAELASEQECKKLIQESGPVDLLILNASAQVYMTIEDFDGKEFDREYAVNVRASMQLVQGFLAGMKERRFGRIITVGSVNQYRPSPRLFVYAGTKAAQNVMMLSLAKSCGPFGITCNNIAPGVMDTDRNTEVLSNLETAQKLLAVIPARRFGTAEDCAGIALLLCSPAGSYLNGCDIPVDGGMTV